MKTNEHRNRSDRTNRIYFATTYYADISPSGIEAETGDTVPSGDRFSAGAVHGGTAPDIQRTGGREAGLKFDIDFPPADPNPNFPQGEILPVMVPLPYTVPPQPWQLPPGSAIPQ